MEVKLDAFVCLFSLLKISSFVFSLIVLATLMNYFKNKRKKRSRGSPICGEVETEQLSTGGTLIWVYLMSRLDAMASYDSTTLLVILSLTDGSWSPTTFGGSPI